MVPKQFFLSVCLLFVIGCFSNIYAQSNRIHGRVTDAKTGKPLPGVNIFLDKTTVGTFSDKNGSYSIGDLPSGNYTLVFSFVGYKRITKQLSIPSSFENEINVSLDPKKYGLNELDVKGDDPKEWRRNLKRFKKWFLGSSRNVDETHIENPVILDFRDVDGQFIATAEEPLIIVNRALGYKIYFFLDYFTIQNNGFAVNGYTRFIPLEPENFMESGQWEKERKRAYHGSFKEFITTLRRGNLLNKGYRISFVNYVTTAGYDNAGGERMGAEIRYPGYLWNYVRINQIRLSTYNGYDFIKVKYKREIPELRIAQEANLSRKLPQISYLEFPSEKAILNIKSMTYQDPYICIFNGYWAYSSRMPEWLPQDYKPQ